ncbi:MAG: DUF262 domain-containing protein [Nanoarchaeota archaeon]|nr:DUF262 domain-containing protein [Nanoarchaeota archaeon]
MENLFLTDQEIIKIFKEHLKIESRVISVEDLFGIRNRTQIDYRPYYQRKYVWNNEKATYFMESILIGTEIPPLIFFHGNNQIEIIDGRQRFETIKNFMEDKLVLNPKGLMILKSLGKLSFSKLNKDILIRFLDSKIRVIDFRVINEPKLDPKKEDLIKKEIFRRYNSGITPLRRSDVDKATFIDDPITKKIKEKFQNDDTFYKKNLELFFPKRTNYEGKALLEELISKIRLLTVLHLIPIKYYSTLSNRKDIMNMFYHKYSEEEESLDLFMSEYEKRIEYLYSIKKNINNVYYNQLISECMYWVFGVIENEGFALKDILDTKFLEELSKIFESNIQIFSLENSHFYKEFNQRHRFTLEIFEKKLKKDFKNYLDSYNAREIRGNIDLEKENLKEEVIESLFITKPAPTDITIESIKTKMQRDNFRVRPIYQRNEVMNITKASSLIESILLDIKLPPLFVYKNCNSVYEVVDGQQRILAILGFIGETYKDENGNTAQSNKHEFKLKELTIYNELEGLKFRDLEQRYQNKILDFNLSVVEIDSKINENFNPIDLFIRLNSKPYPIKENTFEMWNSYADIDIIKKIKENVKKVEGWFYIRQPKNNNRMENEELYTTLAYIDHMQTFKNEKISKTIDFHKRQDRIACRISDKKYISKLLSHSTTGEKDKDNFLNSIKNIELLILKIRTLLITSDIDKDKLDSYLENELNSLFGLKSRRRLQNFYFLYSMINEINIEMIREKRQEIFQDIQKIYEKLNQVKETENEDIYFEILSNLRDKYDLDKRKVILNDDEKKQLLKNQNNICPICSLSLFYGENIEVDHIKPISKGGRDDIINLQMVHADCNKRKGSKIIIPLVSEDNNFEDVKSYLQRYEDENLEFKSTLLWNIIGKLKDKKIEESVLKTIAGFNNSEGGILLIGVDNQKNILGLNYDLQEGNLLDIDKFEIHLRNIMGERLIVDDGYISKNVKIKFESVDDKTICIINVKKGKKPIYTKDNKFFIRSGNSTIEIGINEVYEYIKNSFES